MIIIITTTIITKSPASGWMAMSRSPECNYAGKLTWTNSMVLSKNSTK